MQEERRITVRESHEVLVNEESDKLLDQERVVREAIGYFERSLQAYGQEGKPCQRCGTPIRRDRSR